MNIAHTFSAFEAIYILVSVITVAVPILEFLAYLSLKTLHHSSTGFSGTEVCRSSKSCSTGSNPISSKCALALKDHTNPYDFKQASEYS